MNGEAYSVVAEFTNIESGRSDTNRPQYQRAIQANWVYGAKLLIGKSTGSAVILISALIAARTPAAMAALKARGMLLGIRTNLAKAGASGAGTNRAEAKAFAAKQTNGLASAAPCP